MAKQYVTVRSATSQADTGQTDTVRPPGWADEATIYLNWTAKAGTTPLMDFKLQNVDPVAGTALDFQWNGITQLSSEALVVIHVGLPNVDTEDDTGVVYFLKDDLPGEMNLVTTLDRTSSNEVYTYTIAIEYRDH